MLIEHILTRTDILRIIEKREGTEGSKLGVPRLWLGLHTKRLFAGRPT